MLIVRMLIYLKENGYQTVSLGLAPLSGMEGPDIAVKTVKFAYENLRTFGHFKGLRRYKEKFQPIWEKKYLIHQYEFHLLQVPKVLRGVSRMR